MAERLDALVARKYTDRDGNEKTQWTKIGAAFPTQAGGYSVTLEALPLPTMGDRGLETRILLMVPKPRDDQRSQSGSSQQAQRRQQSYGEQSGGSYGGGRDLDDEIPFIMEWR